MKQSEQAKFNQINFIYISNSQNFIMIQQPQIKGCSGGKMLE